MQQVRTTDSVWVIMLLVGALAILASPAWAQEEVDFQEQLDPIMGRIVNATDVQDVRDAADRLAAQYDAFVDDPDLQYQFAVQTGDAILTALNTIAANPNDDLAMLREVNLAIAGAHLRRVSSLALFESLIVHDNPAVRYYGWIGYDQIRTLLLAQGFDADALTNSLAQRLPVEPSAEVVAVMLDVMALPTRRDDAIQIERYQQTTLRFLELSNDTLPHLARNILRGQYDWAETADVAFDTLLRLRRVHDAYTPDEPMPESLLQNTVDVLTAASVLYAGSEPNSRSFNAASALMLSAEELLNDITNLQRSFVNDALTDRMIADQDARNTAVQLAAIEWARLLADQGVTPTDLQNFDDEAPADDDTDEPIDE
jgi:hypothetical protein